MTDGSGTSDLITGLTKVAWLVHDNTSAHMMPPDIRLVNLFIITSVCSNDMIVTVYQHLCHRTLICFAQIKGTHSVTDSEKMFAPLKLQKISVTAQPSYVLRTKNA